MLRSVRKMRYALVILTLACPLHGQRPSEAEAHALIERARTTALRYNASLPDFICTQVVHRFQDPRRNGRWQSLDVLTVRLSYAGRREDYKLVEINGKPTLLDYMNTEGPTSKGEFGTLLLLLFHPDIQTEFRWKGWTTIRKQRAAVFSYKVDRAHSQFEVRYGAVDQGPNDIIVPYYGEVAFLPESGDVLRVSQHAVLPLNFAIKESSGEVEYDYTEVGGRRFLLPVSAEILMATSRYKTRNFVEFKDYRKFQTETTITFDK